MGLVGAKNIIAGVIYHPPGQVIKDFNKSQSNCPDIINKGDKKCYILGDFNINLFFPLIHKAARVKDNSSSSTDNIHCGIIVCINLTEIHIFTLLGL